MRYPKAKIWIVFLSLVAIFILAACDTGGPPASSGTPTSAPVATSAPTTEGPRPTAARPTSAVSIATKAPTREAVPTDQPLGDWQLVNSEEGGFSVQMPIKPKEGTSPIKGSTGNTVDLHTFIANTGSAEYTMTYVDYPAEVAAQGSATVLNNTLAGVIGKNTPLSKKSVTVNGSPGLEVEFVDEASKNYAWYKSVARDTRIYQMILIAKDKDATSADAGRFLDSLKLTGAMSQGTPAPTEADATSVAGETPTTSSLSTRTTDGGVGGDWQTFTSPEGRFSLEMPGQPQEGTQSVDVAGGTMDIHTLSLSGDQAVYTLTYSDLPAAATQSGAAPVLQGALTGVVGQNTLLDQQNITVQGNPGIEGAFDAQSTGYTRYRAILVGERLYQLIAISPDQETSAQEVQRFLDSFKLTP